MAIVTRSSIASLDPNNGQFVAKGISGSYIPAVSPCFMKSDGKIYASAITSGSTPDGRAMYLGFNPISASANDVVSLYKGIFEYSTDLTPGTGLYITAGSPGYLETTPPTSNVGVASTGSAVFALNEPVAYVLDSKRIVVVR